MYASFIDPRTNCG